jgi:hypothetical protein
MQVVFLHRSLAPLAYVLTLNSQVMEKAQSATVDTVDLATAHRGSHDAIQYALDVSRYLVGRHKLRRIQDDADVQIFVPRPDAIAAGNTAIEIVGKVKEAVDRARKEVDAVVKAIPPTSIAKVDIDVLVHRHLIGKKGQRIRSFEDKKAVDIVFPPNGEERNDLLVVYVGTGDGKAVLEGWLERPAFGFFQVVFNLMGSLAEAVTELRKLAKEAADIKVITLNVPAKFHRHILGPNGTTLNAIIGEEKAVAVRCGVTKAEGESSPGAEDKISIRGPTEEVSRVEKEILRIAEDAKENEIVNSYVRVARLSVVCIFARARS